MPCPVSISLPSPFAANTSQIFGYIIYNNFVPCHLGEVIKSQMKIRIIGAAVLLIFLAILILLFVLNQDKPGRLIFTDYATANHNYTVDVFDLEQNTRSSLPRVAYEDVGSLYPIDERHIYASMCFIHNNNSFFCSAGISEIIAPDQVKRFDVVKQVWKENYGSPVWSPDGSRVAFILRSEGTKDNPLYRGDMLIVDADGTNLLDPTPNEADNGFYFSWSPDSQQLAFVCSKEQKLCIVDADGSHLQQLDVVTNTKVRDIAWSPNSNQIAFSLSEQDSFSAEIYLVNADGTDMHRLLEAGGNFHEEPVWSPDGSKIAFRSGEQNNNIGEIYVIEPDGANLHNLSQSLDGTEFGATWSPDSSRIAFFSHRYSDQKNFMYLYVTEADGTNLQRITDNQTWDLTDVGSPELFWLP